MRLWESLLGGRQPKNDTSFSLDEMLPMFADPTRLLSTSWGNLSSEEMIRSVESAYRENGPVFALSLARMQIFSQARFQWTRSTDGTPNDMFGSQDLQVLEFPRPGARTSTLLNEMEADVTSAGNSFVRRIRRGAGTNREDRLTRLRPQWVTILMGSQEDGSSPWDAADVEVLGYIYRPNGDASRMQVFDRTEVAHYAPIPDPHANFRGISWVTPSLTTVRADQASELHKFKFFENAATPNIAIKFDPSVTVEQMKAFKEFMDEGHQGAAKAYKTLYLGGGADPQVIGKDFQQLSFAATQAKGETRLAADAGVPPSWVGFSEGLQGSALNDGNYNSARRRFADGTIQHLWESVSTALEVLVERPKSRNGQAPARLAVDPRSIPFLREDMADQSLARQQDAATIASLVREGFTPESAIAAVKANDWGLLVHTGLTSVQLQSPATPNQNGGSDA